LLKYHPYNFNTDFATELHGIVTYCETLKISQYVRQNKQNAIANKQNVERHKIKQLELFAMYEWL